MEEDRDRSVGTPAGAIDDEPATAWRTLRRVSTACSVLGGVLLVAATWLLVSRSTGRVGTTVAGEYGQTVVVEVPTPSILERSPDLAQRWVVASIAVAVLFALLIRFGHVVGPAVVLVVMWFLVTISILTIGIYLAPAAGMLALASVLAISARAGSRERHTGHASGVT